MKRICYYAVAMTAMMMLVSCLKGGSNSMKGTTVGVIRVDSKTNKKVLDNPLGYGPFYSIAFQDLKENACVIVAYELNQDEAENASNIVKKNGYYTIHVKDKAELDRYMLRKFSDPETPDTAKILEKEVPILNPNYQLFGYVNGYMFVGHVLKQPADQKYDWFLSYNPENMVKEEAGDRIYDVFLRSQIKVPSKKSETDMMVANAYYMKDYLEKIARDENGKGTSRFFLRFNYVSSVKNGKLTWSKGKKVGPFDVKSFLNMKDKGK